MPVTHDTLTGLFDDIADAIRAKTGGTADIVADEFPDAIGEIETGVETFYATNGSYAFYTRIMNYPSRLPNLEGCTYLEEVHAPNSTVSIATNQFHDCPNLKIIDVPNVTSIAGVTAFGGCIALKQVAFPKVKTWYNLNVFIGCTALEQVQLGSVGNPINAVGSSKYSVFNGCTQSGLTITLYVADDAVIPFNYQPWGATNATIVYRSATTGEVLIP